MSISADWLIDDVQQNRNQIETNDSPLNRRNYLHSLFSYYEFSLSTLRERTAQLIISSYEFNGHLDIHELYALMDNTVRLSDNGHIKLDNNRLPFLSLAAFTLKTYAKLINFEKAVLSDHRWESLCKSIKIRNRITHPKLDTDIEISNDELKIIYDGWSWWIEIVKQLRDADLTAILNIK